MFSGLVISHLMREFTKNVRELESGSAKLSVFQIAAAAAAHSISVEGPSGDTRDLRFVKSVVGDVSGIGNSEVLLGFTTVRVTNVRGDANVKRSHTGTREHAHSTNGGTNRGFTHGLLTLHDTTGGSVGHGHDVNFVDGTTSTSVGLDGVESIGGNTRFSGRNSV